MTITLKKLEQLIKLVEDHKLSALEAFGIKIVKTDHSPVIVTNNLPISNLPISNLPTNNFTEILKSKKATPLSEDEILFWNPEEDSK